jgi:hypothetical protein
MEKWSGFTRLLCRATTMPAATAAVTDITVSAARMAPKIVNPLSDRNPVHDHDLRNLFTTHPRCTPLRDGV